jgi:tRNA(fMet)-specific endonuclease VapC
MKHGEMLLDSDVVIAAFRQDPGAQKALRDATRVLIPVIVLGELLAGARKGGQVERETRRIDDLIAAGQVLGCDLETAHHYAAVRDELRLQGRPIPDNDVWIAALARQHGLTLASRDNHFAGIEGLRVEPCRN